MPDQDYHKAIKDFQQQMDEQLRAPDGWLTLVGLHWLEEGLNTIGSDQGNTIPLPKGTCPPLVGKLYKNNHRVTFEPADQILVTTGEQPIKSKIELESDLNQNQTILEVGQVSFYLVIRGSRYGIRVKQEDSPNRLDFEGRVWWPIDEDQRVEAEIEYYNPQKMIDVPDVLGNIIQTAMDCALRFSIDDQLYVLDAFRLPSGQFYVLFHDLSCQNGSYPAGRFLITEHPEAETVVIDFNKAHNPPCAFTSYTTCPLPPKQNYLSEVIQAGERYVPLKGWE